MHVGNSAHVHRIVEDAIRGQLEPVKLKLKDTIRGQSISQLEPIPGSKTQSEANQSPSGPLSTANP